MVKSGAIQETEIESGPRPTQRDRTESWVSGFDAPPHSSRMRGTRGGNPVSVSAPSICYTIDFSTGGNATHTRHETHSCHADAWLPPVCLSAFRRSTLVRISRAGYAVSGRELCRGWDGNQTLGKADEDGRLLSRWESWPRDEEGIEVVDSGVDYRAVGACSL